jgi:hypothetical protein
VGWLIEEYLTECEVLEALSSGLLTPHSSQALIWLLDGFRLYRGLARSADNADNTSQRASAVAKVNAALALLEHNQNESVRNAVASARHSFLQP